MSLSISAGDRPSWLERPIARIFAISALSLIAAYVLLRFGVAIMNGGNYWTLGDWLINYEGGFVRRGVSGTASLWLSDLTGLSLTYTAGAMMAAIYAAMATLYIYCFTSMRLSGPLLMLMFSPVLLLMPFYYVKTAMVKETVAFLALVMFATSAITGRSIWLWLGAGVYAFACFAHEAMAFFVPFLWVFAWLFHRQGVLSRQAAYAFAATVTAIGATAFGLAFLFQGQGASGVICDAVLARGVRPDVCTQNGVVEQTGPITWLELTTRHGIQFMLDAQIRSGVWPQYVLGYVLAILPFFCFRVAGDETGQQTRRVLLAVVFGILAFAPLFVVATDWGRWIAMYVFVLAMLLLAALRQNLIEPRDWPIGPLFLLYAFGWSLSDYSDGLAAGLLPKVGRAVERVLSIAGMA